MTAKKSSKSHHKPTAKRDPGEKPTFGASGPPDPPDQSWRTPPPEFETPDDSWRHEHEKRHAKLVDEAENAGDDDEPEPDEVAPAEPPSDETPATPPTEPGTPPTEPGTP